MKAIEQAAAIRDAVERTARRLDDTPHRAAALRTAVGGLPWDILAMLHDELLPKHDARFYNSTDNRPIGVPGGCDLTDEQQRELLARLGVEPRANHADFYRDFIKHYVDKAAMINFNDHVPVGRFRTVLGSTFIRELDAVRGMVK